MSERYAVGTCLLNPASLDAVMVRGYTTDGRMITEDQEGGVNADDCDWLGWQVIPSFKKEAHVVLSLEQSAPCPYVAAALTGLLANPNVVVHNHLTGWAACNTDWAGVVAAAREIGKIASEGK